MKKITVIGSLNMDVVLTIPHMPETGETISAESMELVPGGKGANQAYTIGRLGGCVGMIGAVGGDSAGKALVESLRQAGVDTEGIETLEGEPSGQAFITVDKDGNNAIIIVAGANGKVTAEMVRRHEDMIRESDIIVMQMEIPADTVAYVKDMAAAAGKQIVLDPAPALPDFDEGLWKGVDYVKPNETELAILTGCRTDTEEEMKEGARTLLAKGVKNVIVSLGSRGCMLVSKEKEAVFPANRVKAVDTTAAGDSFTAAFALALAEGKTCEEAVRFGQEVSSIVVTRKGAQTSIPDREEVNRGRGISHFTPSPIGKKAEFK